MQLWNYTRCAELRISGQAPRRHAEWRSGFWLATLLFLYLFIPSTCLEAATCAPPSPGLIGWWPGDANANDIVGTNNGAVQPGAVAGAAGFVGQGFNFDGTNGYVQIADAPSLHPTNLTIEAWVRFSSLDSQGSGNSPAGQQYLVFHQNSQTKNFEGFELGKTRLGGRDYFEFVVSPATGQAVAIQSATSISTGVWYHVAGVRGANFLQLYINGVMERQATVSFEQDYGNYPLYFGTTGESYWDHKFKGTLDEVSLYGRALAANEISAIYTAGASGKCKAPNVTLAPVSQTVAAGSSVTFLAAASGVPPPAYQWQFNGVDIPGATVTNLVLTNVQTAQAGSYALVATNVSGAVTSSPAVLTVVTAPVFTAAPQSSTNIVGSTATFGATASGSSLSYWWTWNGLPLTDGSRVSGASTVALNIAAVQLSDVGNYALVASNIAGVVTSSVATLTVITPPIISRQPANQSAVVGMNVDFSVGASGDPPLTYQWLRNGTNLSDGGNLFGTTSATLSLSNVQSIDAAAYYVIVANPAGAITSTVTHLTVTLTPVAPLLTLQPASQMVTAPGSVTFTAAADGTIPLSYQWQKNGTPLTDGPTVSGATAIALTLLDLQTNDAGNYTVVVTNPVGSVTSTVAALSVAVLSNPTLWETSNIGAVWSDDFNRAALGSNWIILSNATATIVSNELRFAQTNLNAARAVYYQPWLTCASAWTLRWTQRFGTVDNGSIGVGFGLKNFQAAGGNDRGYNAMLNGAGANRGMMQIQRSTGTSQVLASSGPAMTLAAGDIVDCWFTRSNWTMTATASNRANAQVSSTTIVYSDSAGLYAPTISRACFYPMGGTVFVDDVSFTLNHRKPARFIQIGASSSDGYNATNFDHAFVSVVQSNYNEAFCNASSSYNSTSNSVSILPEILAYQPGTAILLVGDNDLRFGYPTFQWQNQYSNLVAQMQANGVKVKHCLPTPQNQDVSPLRNWLQTTYSNDVIDTWTPLVKPGGTTLQTNYDSGDSLHPNDAGHVLIGQIIISNLPPGIRLQPQSIAIAAGSNASFTVTATSAAPLSYQWLRNGAVLAGGGNVSGAATSALVLSSVQPSDAGFYQVVITNGAGAVTSAVATLSVIFPPVISSQPQGRTNIVGTASSFAVSASGTAPLSYQWRFNGTNLPGATNANLILNNVQPSDAGVYSLTITNLAGSATSDAAGLLVLVPPAFTTQPQSRTNLAGTVASLDAAASGTTPLNYQWKFNGTDLFGATAAGLVLANVQTSNAGAYTVVVTNAAGSATSTAAVLTVLSPPVIFSNPVGHTNNAGTSAAFQVGASGAPPLHYRWFHNENYALSDVGNITGAATPTLTVSGVLGPDAGTYSVIITNTDGAATSAPVTLAVNDPVIISQPASQTNHAGTEAVFEVGIAGSPSVFQWFKDGVPTSGATAQALHLPAVTPADAAGYSVLVSNNFGNLFSVTSTLSVSPALLIQSLTLTHGTAAITWSAIPGKTYSLQSKDNFEDPAWTTAIPSLTATGALATGANLLGTSTQRFYRVYLIP
jgi:hypothetical protein